MEHSPAITSSISSACGSATAWTPSQNGHGNSHSMNRRHARSCIDAFHACSPGPHTMHRRQRAPKERWSAAGYEAHAHGSKIRSRAVQTCAVFRHNAALMTLLIALGFTSPKVYPTSSSSRTTSPRRPSSWMFRCTGVNRSSSTCVAYSASRSRSP